MTALKYMTLTESVGYDLKISIGIPSEKIVKIDHFKEYYTNDSCMRLTNGRYDDKWQVWGQVACIVINVWQMSFQEKDRRFYERKQFKLSETIFPGKKNMIENFKLLLATSWQQDFLDSENCKQHVKITSNPVVLKVLTPQYP